MQIVFTEYKVIGGAGGALPSKAAFRKPLSLMGRVEEDIQEG